MSKEILLNKDEKRYTLFPIKYQDIWEYYKKQEGSFWRVEEVDLSKDDWNSLNKDEQYFFENILGFFSASDGIVAENIAENFQREIQLPEAKFFYSLQCSMENIHSLAYSLMIDTYIKDYKRKQQLFNSIENLPAVKRKAEWAIKYINNGTLAERLIAFILIENLFFSASFCSVYWLREQNKLPGLCTFNDWISRDETLHGEFGTFLYNKYIQNKLEDSKVKEIIEEARNIEKEFILESLPVKLIGMNSDLMSNYIDYVTDNIYMDLGFDIKMTKNPFKFMEKIAAERKKNFFEKRVAEYSKADLNSLNLNTDF